MRIHVDERRQFFGDIFDTPNGDVNLVKLARRQTIAWHKHARQDDKIFVVKGRLLVQSYHMLTDTRHVWPLSALKQRAPLIIPAGWWHGYESQAAETIVLQFNGPGKWDGTDEQRHAIEADGVWAW